MLAAVTLIVLSMGLAACGPTPDHEPFEREFRGRVAALTRG
jgi:hypothetical protein